MTTCLDYNSYNFMSGNHRKNGTAPFIAGLVNIGMTDTTIKNIDQHIMGPWFATDNFIRFNWRFCGLCGISWSM